MKLVIGHGVRGIFHCREPQTENARNQGEDTFSCQEKPGWNVIMQFHAPPGSPWPVPGPGPGPKKSNRVFQRFFQTLFIGPEF